MRKKTALLIALVIIISISISYFLWFLHSKRNGAYERTIVRNTSTVEEANALTIAENLNYSAIFDLQRFRSWGNHSWANFIDTHVIEYYDGEFESLKGTIDSVKFHYEANVFTWNQIHVVFNKTSDKIQVLSPNGSLLFENARYTGAKCGMLFAYRNDSKYQSITEGFEFAFSKSYIIEMTLQYDEVRGPLAGWWARLYQIILVDDDFVPSLFCVQPANIVAS